VEGVSGTVHECGDGETAIELYQRLHPDWVLMDVRMGGMDGIAATAAIRKADPAARIIIVTERQESEYAGAARAAGASGFVGKENLLALPALLVGGAAGHPGEGAAP
jgi:DNA-binding NarL/FixJ family response regulator